jgi:DNA-binding LacI/PurR family transcriptional regulator
LGGRETVCSQETAERIRSAVTELQYAATLPSRSSRKLASKTIGVCIPDALAYDMTFANTFFSELWAGIAVEADRENYCLLHFPIATRVSALAEAFMTGKVEGIILFNFDKERAAKLASQSIPTLLLSASFNIPAGCSNAYADEGQTAHLALQHLWDLGHRRIAHVSGPVGHVTSTLHDDDVNWRYPTSDDVAVLRQSSYNTWMKARDAHDPELVIQGGSWELHNPEEVVMKLKTLSNPPTAVFCGNDLLAIELLDYAQRLGMRVPDDLSIVGVDNSASARECYPKLTSVNVPIIEVGRQGLRALLSVANNNILHQLRVKVPVTELIVRASTGPITARTIK